MKIKQWSSLALALGIAGVVATGCVVAPEPRGMVVSEAPPPPQVEIVPVAPGPGFIWVEGHWGWRGRWVWESGRYVSRPHSRAAWVPGHWVAGRRGWVWVPGRWR